jgi:WD40 repeat protein
VSSRTEVFSIPDHSLLRVIGRGSYGEVWLARNVMGTLRAVKIVRRAAFESDRPYLREFEGIRRCEPVSRAHDGLIDILHMGRHDEEGWFYYVMELADDASGSSGVETYLPATLAERLSRGPRMEVTECLRIAESLAGALAFLHEQGLIHRDVKPSNVLYAGGVPKLGDIGLVAEAGSSRSFVGTEGFVPLEGPGTERADIFAFGKVLYEALTGQDREKFPRLPAWWAEDAEFDQRVELNEIVLRACEGDAVRRYHSARELLADVAIIASGRSVRKLRGMERRLRLLKWVAGSVAALALAALGVSGVWRQQANRERSVRERAENAEVAALLDQVRAARHDPSAGAVLRGLAAAREAAALRVTPELRDDAVFLLSRPDFKLNDDPSFPVLRHAPWAIDADSGLMAEVLASSEASSGPLTFTLHTAGAPKKERTLTVPNAPPGISTIQFSRGGQRLLFTDRHGAGFVVDTATGAMIHPEPFPPSYDFGTPLVFCGDKGEAVIRRANDGGIAYYTLPDGKRFTTPPPADWPVRDQDAQPQRLWPSPDGRTVLLIDNELQLPEQTSFLSTLFRPAASTTRGAACLVEIATGRILWKVSGPDEQVAAWSADGTRIAVRHSDYIVSLNARTGKPASTVPQRIRNRGTQLVFLDSRDFLVFSTWSMTGLCDVSREQMLGRPPVLEGWSYSSARGFLTAVSGTAEWKPSPMLRILHPACLANRAVFVSFSPNEDWLIVGQGPAFAGWRMDRKNSEPDFTLPATGAAGVVFSPDEKSAQFLTDDGRHETAWAGQPPESLPAPLPYGLEAGGQSAFTSASADGKVLAFGGRGYVIVREGDNARAFPTEDVANPVALSPDGRWLAIGAFRQQDVRVFDLHRSDDQPVHVIACGAGCFPAFSPDGKWLACSGFLENQVFARNAGAPGAWPLVFRKDRRSSSLCGYISFSADGRLMALMDTMTRVAMLEPGTWRVLFHLDSPLDEIFERNALSPSGRYFAAVGTRREIYLWDLQALQVELRRLGLSPE